MSDDAKAGKPGDEAEPGIAGTGDDICPVCNGTGTVKGAACQECRGTGTITRAIGGG